MGVKIADGDQSFKIASIFCLKLSSLSGIANMITVACYLRIPQSATFCKLLIAITADYRLQFASNLRFFEILHAVA
jgi:hypothetical protein